jgi:hypothetical protein
MPQIADYSWFDVTEQGLSVGCCLTFVKDLTADEVVRRLAGTVVAEMAGLDELEEHSAAVTIPPNAHRPDGSVVFGESTGREFAAVADRPGGVLIVEPYGFLTTVPEINRPLSRGTDVAVVHLSENNEEKFVWASGGDVRTEFDFRHAHWREGTEPDALLARLRDLGFNLSTADDPDDPGWFYDERAVARAFTLAEQLTGVGFTEEVLTTPRFLAVSVPSPF